MRILPLMILPVMACYASHYPGEGEPSSESPCRPLDEWFETPVPNSARHLYHAIDTVGGRTFISSVGSSLGNDELILSTFDGGMWTTEVVFTGTDLRDTQVIATTERIVVAYVSDFDVCFSIRTEGPVWEQTCFDGNGDAIEVSLDENRGTLVLGWTDRRLFHVATIRPNESIERSEFRHDEFRRQKIEVAIFDDDLHTATSNDSEDQPGVNVRSPRGGLASDDALSFAFDADVTGPVLAYYSYGDQASYLALSGRSPIVVAAGSHSVEDLSMDAHGCAHISLSNLDSQTSLSMIVETSTGLMTSTEHPGVILRLSLDEESQPHVVYRDNVSLIYATPI